MNKAIITFKVEAERSMEFQTYLLIVAQALKLSGHKIDLITWDSELSKEEMEILIGRKTP